MDAELDDKYHVQGIPNSTNFGAIRNRTIQKIVLIGTFCPYLVKKGAIFCLIDKKIVLNLGIRTI